MSRGPDLRWASPLLSIPKPKPSASLSPVLSPVLTGSAAGSGVRGQWPICYDYYVDQKECPKIDAKGQVTSTSFPETLVVGPEGLATKQGRVSLPRRNRHRGIAPSSRPSTYCPWPDWLCRHRWARLSLFASEQTTGRSFTRRPLAVMTGAPRTEQAHAAAGRTKMCPARESRHQSIARTIQMESECFCVPSPNRPEPDCVCGEDVNVEQQCRCGEKDHILCDDCISSEVVAVIKHTFWLRPLSFMFFRCCTTGEEYNALFV